jgi:hypothetical protein
MCPFILRLPPNTTTRLLTSGANRESPDYWKRIRIRRCAHVFLHGYVVRGGLQRRRERPATTIPNSSGHPAAQPSACGPTVIPSAARDLSRLTTVGGQTT